LASASRSFSTVSDGSPLVEIGTMSSAAWPSDERMAGENASPKPSAPASGLVVSARYVASASVKPDDRSAMTMAGT